MEQEPTKDDLRDLESLVESATPLATRRQSVNESARADFESYRYSGDLPDQPAVRVPLNEWLMIQELCEHAKRRRFEWIGWIFLLAVWTGFLLGWANTR